jgi:hypothetical protein
MSTQESLGRYFRERTEKHRHRQERGEEPDDLDDLVRIDRLESLAGYCLSLPDDDPRIVALAAIALAYGIELSFPEEVDDLFHCDAVGIDPPDCLLHDDHELTWFVRHNIFDLLRHAEVNVEGMDSDNDQYPEWHMRVRRVQGIELDLLAALHVRPLAHSE